MRCPRKTKQCMSQGNFNTEKCCCKGNKIQDFLNKILEDPRWKLFDQIGNRNVPSWPQFCAFKVSVIGWGGQWGEGIIHAQATSLRGGGRGFGGGGKWYSCSNWYACLSAWPAANTSGLFWWLVVSEAHMHLRSYWSPQTHIHNGLNTAGDPGHLSFGIGESNEAGVRSSHLSPVSTVLMGTVSQLLWRPQSRPKYLLCPWLPGCPTSSSGVRRGILHHGEYALLDLAGHCLRLNWINGWWLEASQNGC